MIYQYSKSGDLIKIWNRIEEILKENTNYIKNGIIDNINHPDRRKSAYGYVWKFINANLKQETRHKKVHENIIIDKNNFLKRDDYNYPDPNIEYWKDLENYEDRYKISTFGNIYSKNSNTLLKFGINSQKQITFAVSVNKKRNTHVLHTFVAKHFILNPNNYDRIRHIDTDKSNNNINNLEWTTQSIITQNYVKSKTPISIFQYDLNNNLIKEWKSIDEIIQENPEYIKNRLLKICGNTNRLYGYFWEKDNDIIYQKDCSGKIIKEWNSINAIVKYIALNNPKFNNNIKNNKKRFVTYLKYPNVYRGYIWKLNKKSPIKFVKLENDEKFRNIGIINDIDFSNYEISNYGKVKNLDTGYFMTNVKHNSGYDMIILQNKKERLTISIHKLVALSWIEKNDTNEKLIINHIDENKNNNHDNLEWVTYQQNIIHSFGKKVYQLDPKTNKLLNTFNSMKEAATAVGLKTTNTIKESCTIKHRLAAGYKWKWPDT